MNAFCRELTRPWVASAALFCLFVLVWQLLTGGGSGPAAGVDPEYARLAGQSAAQTQSAAIPSPVAVAKRGYELAINAFDNTNPNNLGIAWHLYYSLGRVLLGFFLAVIVAVPLGFALGLMPRV